MKQIFLFVFLAIGAVGIYGWVARVHFQSPASTAVPAFETPATTLSSTDWHWARPRPPFLGNQNIVNFPTAKKLIARIQSAHPHTIYCDCLYEEKKILIDSCGYKPQRDEARARRLEWEHVVPAENFGRSFVDWREGSRACVHKGRPYKGRKCAELNPQFNQIEGDMYNLWPEDGELNGLRNDFSMSELDSSEYDFGRCQARIQDRKFEPEPKARGIVARVYFYMEGAYPGHGILSDKNIKLFEAWDHLYPVTEWECRRTRIIEEAQGNSNPLVKPRCLSAGLWPKSLNKMEKIPPPRFNARPRSRSRDRSTDE